MNLRSRRSRIIKEVPPAKGALKMFSEKPLNSPWKIPLRWYIFFPIETQELR